MEMTEKRLEEIRNEAFAEGYAKAADELGRWRDVRDELPEEMTEVFVYTDHERVSRGMFFNFAKSWRIIDSFTEEVLLWLPFPSLPENNATNR